MQIYVCDICREELPDGYRSIEEEKELLANNPEGIFNLEYRPVITDADGKKIGFGFASFHLCRHCCTTISKSILKEIRRIQESIHKPSVIIPIKKFNTSPVRSIAVDTACHD